MISVTEARTRVLAGLRPVGRETVALSEAPGRVLARLVAARLTQPPADVSAMDGFAVRGAATGETLRVIGAAPAGHPFGGGVGAGEAVRIFTGSVVPAGADAILMQENAEDHGETVLVVEAPRAGQFIRRAGQDFAQGDVLLAAGRRLGAREIGLAAAANHPWLEVYRQPVVAILATGDEIVLPGEPVPPGGIVSSNSAMLAALVRAAGGVPVVLPVAGDTQAAIADAVGPGLLADLLITSGGVSVGAHDQVQAGLGRLGFTADFWKIAMRPGKPLMFGALGHVPVLGLPGNPVSAFVCAVLFALPALAALAGDTGWGLPWRRAVSATDLPANDGREDFLRATLRETGSALEASAFARQDSALLRLLAGADGLVRRAPHAPALAAGEAVEAIDLRRLGV